MGAFMQKKYNISMLIAAILFSLSSDAYGVQKSPYWHYLMEKIGDYTGLWCPLPWRPFPYETRYDFLKSLNANEMTFVDTALAIRIEKATACEQQLHDLKKANATEIEIVSAEFALKNCIEALNILAAFDDHSFYHLYETIRLYRLQHKD